MTSKKAKKTKKEREVEQEAAMQQFVKDAGLEEVSAMDTPHGPMRVYVAKKRAP